MLGHEQGGRRVFSTVSEEPVIIRGVVDIIT